MAACTLGTAAGWQHPLRRTKVSMIYKATGNLRAIQILLGHSKIENTVRYLGVDVEDALLLAERTEICHPTLHGWPLRLPALVAYLSVVGWAADWQVSGNYAGKLSLMAEES